LILTLPITILGQWVKGHYTGKNRHVQHELNDRADDLATAHLDTPPTGFKPRKLPLSQPGYIVRLLYDGSIITSKWYPTLAKCKHDNILRQYIMIITSKWCPTLAKCKHDNNLRQYIMTKAKWTPRQFDRVDWTAHSRAFHRVTRTQQVAIVKLIHNLCNTNRQNHLYYQSSPLCPLSQEAGETFEHVLMCPHNLTQETRNKQLTSLADALGKLRTPDELVSTILQGFQHWIHPPNSCSRAPTTGSLAGADILLTAA